MMASTQVSSVPIREPVSATRHFFVQPATNRSMMTVSTSTVTNEARMGSTPRNKSGMSSFQTITTLDTSDTSAPQPTAPPTAMRARARAAKIQPSTPAR